MHHQDNKQARIRILIIAAVAIVAIVAILGITRLVSAGHTNSGKSFVAKASQTNRAKLNNTLMPLPTAPLTCTGTASLVDLTTDYVVSGMNCYSVSNPSLNPAPLSCDGSIFHQVVSFNCYRPYSYSYQNQLVCNGTSVPSATAINLSYNCALPDLNANTIYACTATIGNYNPSSVSLPMSVSCGG